PSQPRSGWHEVSPDKILTTMSNQHHLTGIDEVAYSLINGKDRPVMLVDVRSAEDYARFALPGAVNIPLHQILDHRYENILRSPDQKVVLYSNSNTLATEAWMVATRAGIENLTLLDGGLNGFVQTIFQEEHITDSYNLNVEHQGRFREKARNYFLSGKAVPKTESVGTPVIKLIEIEKPVQGGC
ncbi:MAG: rhodanese-like domain-containing protein, partial [Bacteroidales bacterium]|nr:rhodanese-like domain-containing protein [Bacteroidales bacterium]